MLTRSHGDIKATWRCGLFSETGDGGGWGEDAVCTCPMPFDDYLWLHWVLTGYPHTQLALIMPGIGLIV